MSIELITTAILANTDNIFIACLVLLLIDHAARLRRLENLKGIKDLLLEPKVARAKKKAAKKAAKQRK